MTDKSVAVVGTGSSAVQIGPEVENVASDVKVFQLEANWVLPKLARDFTARERRFNRLWPVYEARRRLLYLRYDLRQLRSGHAIEGMRSHTRRATASRRFLEESLAGRQDLLELVTPVHAFEGKRTVLSDTYYRMLASPKVTLVPYGVTELTERGVRDSSGEEHDLDVVVLATGFDASNYLGTFTVTGDNGVRLHQRWRGEPSAFLGMMVPEFPNFFVMYGPNTNAVPLVSFYEAQARFAAGLIARMTRQGKHRIDVRDAAFVHYNTWLQSRLARTVWATTSSYFRAGAGTGKIVSQWPFSSSFYILALRAAARVAITIR